MSYLPCPLQKSTGSPSIRWGFLLFSTSRFGNSESLAWMEQFTDTAKATTQVKVLRKRIESGLGQDARSRSDQKTVSFAIRVLFFV